MAELPKGVVAVEVVYQVHLKNDGKAWPPSKWNPVPPEWIRPSGGLQDDYPSELEALKALDEYRRGTTGTGKYHYPYLPARITVTTAVTQVVREEGQE